ncbi:MAG: hypothetical protein WC869_02440 [Phycisphaerae bacterium]
MKVLIIVLAGLVVCAAVTVLAAKYWIIPAVAASQIRSAVGDSWGGSIHVGGVEFNFSGPIYLRGIELHDRVNRRWLHVASIELTLRDWPGLSPALTTIDVRGLTLNTYFLDGRLDAPFRAASTAAPAPADLGKYVDIRELVVHDISCEMNDDQARQARWTFPRLEASRQSDGAYTLWLLGLPGGIQDPADANETFHLSGWINPATCEADLMVDGDLPTDADRMGVMLRALDVPVLRGMRGRLHSENVRLRGRLNQGGLWQLSGQVDLNGFTVDGPYGRLTDRLDATLRLEGRRATLTQFDARGCGGKVTVSGQLDIAADGKPTYSAAMEASGVDLPRLTEVVAGPGGKSQRGTLTAQAKVSGDGGTIRGSGLLGLDDADLMPSLIFAEVFKQMGLGSGDRLHKSDLQAVIAFDGPRVTIERARLANALSAMDVEKGGKINVQTHQLDLYVVGVPLKAVEALLRLPLIGTLTEPFRNLRDKLIRLYVHGDWSDPPGTLVTKKPITDAASGAVGFFQDAAKSGGELGQDAVNTFKDIFRALGKKQER